MIALTIAAGALAAEDAAQARVRERLAEILARPEFRPRRRGITDWIGDRLSDAFEWLSDLFGFKVPAGLFVQGLYVLGFLVLALGLFLAIRRLLRAARRDSPSVVSVAAQRAARAAQLLAQAREAAQRGDLTLAARDYFWALVVGLSERGAIEYRDSWTFREALERGAPAAEITALLTPLVPKLDALSFGHAPVLAGDVEELASLCDRWLAGALA